MTQLFVVSLIIFLSFMATYSYNSLMDINEDRDNHLHPNPLKELKPNKFVKKIPHILFASSLIISLLFTNLMFLLLFSFSVLFSIIYSKYKIKRLLFIKTISVSFIHMILFFSCYFAFSYVITYNLLVAGILVYVLFFSYSIISDIRDIESDRKYNLITIPVRYGYIKSKILIIFLFLVFNFITVLSFVMNIISLKLAIISSMFIPIEAYLAYYLHIQDFRNIDILREKSFIYITLIILISNFVMI